MISKTNAIRILELKNINHQVIVYDCLEEEIDAVSVAKKIGLPPMVELDSVKILFMSKSGTENFIAINK